MRILALLAVTAATGAAPVALPTAHTVTALAAAGNRIAFAMTDCGVRLWDRTARKVTAFGRGPACERTSTGTRVSGIAVAGTRVLFLHYTGGNIREWSLWTATPTSPKPRRLQFATSDPDAAPPIVVGQGGGLLSYAIGKTVTALRPDGARAYRWTAPARVTALGGDAGRVAVATETGSVYVLDGKGSVARTVVFSRALDAVQLTPKAVVAQYGRTLETRGTGMRTFALGAGTHLVDADGSRALLVSGGNVRTLALGTGAGALVGHGSLAALEPQQLVVANGRTISASAG